MLGLIVPPRPLTLAGGGPPTSAEPLPIRVAEAEGHFAREGLTVTIRTTRAEWGAAEALAQGQVDLAATTLEAVLRFGPRSATQAPRLVFGLTAAPPVALVVGAPHAGTVRSIEDLSALRVGVTTPGAPEHAWFGWLLARAGVSVAQVRVTSLGGRGLIAAVDSGEVHVALVQEPMATQLLGQGRAKLLARFLNPRGARPGPEGDQAARRGAAQLARRFPNPGGRRGDARRRHRERRGLCPRRPPPAGPRLVRARARAQKGRAADPDRRGQGAGRQA